MAHTDRQGAQVNGNQYSNTSLPLLDNDGTKPNLLLEFDGKKTEDYYLKEAKWAVNNGYDSRHISWLSEISIVKSFYKGDQWIYREDIDSFLKDETDTSRNRIKMVHNLFRPMIEQYRGNAIRMSINARAKSISNQAYTRREEALGKLLLLVDVANEFPSLGEILRKENPEIGENKEDTTETFNNVYTDKYVEKVNYLIQFVSEINELERTQKKAAMNMAFSGWTGTYCYNYGGHMRTQQIEPENFFFDRNARREDLQDASFMGFRMNTSLPTILEKYQGISPEERQALKNHVSVSGQEMFDDSNYEQNNNFMVYTVFFKSTMTKEAGYVKDENGEPYLAFMNEVDSITGETYTEADLISPPDNKKNKRLFKGNKKRKVVLEVIENCIFISGKEIGYTVANTNGKDVTTDIVLEYGPVEYAETNWKDPSDTKYPIKSHTWALVDGEILSPMSDSLNPQRFVNRILSATEAQINASGGTGPIFDKDMFDSSDHEMETQSNVKQGKAVFMRSKGRGINNSVGTYDNTVKQGTYGMFEIVNIMKQMVQDTSGVNEGLKGESTGSDQLVGVTKLLIQRGSLMQEPFYEAIADMYVQIYQYVASSGVRMYLDNEMELEIAVGEEGVRVFKLSEGMRGENFRAFIKRDNDPEMVYAQADQTMLGLLEMQIIDAEFYAEMAGRSSIEQVYSRLRTVTALKKEAARKAAEEQAAAAEMMAQEEAGQQEQLIQAEQEAQNQQQLFDAAKMEAQNNHEIDKIAAKGMVDNQNQMQNNSVG